MKRPTERPAKDQPWISNYPPLHDWLMKHSARCMWQITEDPDKFVEAWLIKTSIVIVVVYAKQGGWELYTAANTNNITKTLADADARVGP